MSKVSISAAVLTLGVASVMIAAPVTVYATEGNNQQTVNAEKSSIAIPVDTVARGDEGEVKVLSTKDVENGEYTVHVVAVNQGSEHPNSNIIVTSNGSEVVVADVERKAFQEAEGDGTLTVSDGKVTVSVQLGRDEVFSGGVKVVLTPVVPEQPEEPEEPEEEEEEPKVSSATTEKPQVLPATGAGAALSIFAGTSGLGYIAHRLTSRKRQ